MKVYEGFFDSWLDIQCQFEFKMDEPKYVWAEYDGGSYDGWATVITSDDGVIFQVAEGSHCSCYGLEGQWDPTTHSREELERMYGNRSDIMAWLKGVPHD